MKPFFDDIDASAKELYAAYRSKRMLKVSSANEQLFIDLLRSVDRMRLYVSEDFEGLWLMDTDGSQRRTIPALEAAHAAHAPTIVAQPVVTRAAQTASAQTVSIVPAWRRVSAPTQPLPNIIVSEPASALTRQSGLNPEATEYRPPYSPLQYSQSSLPSSISANSSFVEVNMDHIEPTQPCHFSTCQGCLTDQPNQLAHVGIGGCLYDSGYPFGRY
jgi:hypothetical protein